MSAQERYFVRGTSHVYPSLSHQVYRLEFIRTNHLKITPLA
jgi:hypothetical protein